MFSSGPKRRTTTAFLAIFLGWAGIHKFYLGYHSVGAIHVALTGVGLLALLAAIFVSAGNLIAINIIAWVLILMGYFFVRRVHYGHAVAEIISPGRLILWPWRLMRYTFGIVRFGGRALDAEMEEERWRRRQRRRWERRRGRRHDDDDDDDGGCFSSGCILIALGILLSLVVAAVIVLLYYLIFSFVGFIAVIASIATGVIEGIRYLTRSNDQFRQEYIAGPRRWF